VYHHAAGQLWSLAQGRTDPSPTTAEPSTVTVEGGGVGTPGRWQGHKARTKRSHSANSTQLIQLIKQDSTKVLCCTKPSQLFSPYSYYLDFLGGNKWHRLHPEVTLQALIAEHGEVTTFQTKISHN